MRAMLETAVRHETTRRLRNILWYWVPAVAWVGMVLLASSDAFSAKNTDEVLRTVLAWTFGQIDALTFGRIHFLIRKSAHFTEYAILSALWFRAIRVHLNSLWQIRWALLGLVVSVAVAVLDEWHQSLVPSRTSSAHDVLLDFCGACCAQLVIWFVLHRRKFAAAET